MASALQLVNGTGDFDENGLEAFCRRIELEKCGLSYKVVSIMGPQSSGKSTLLNHLFSTNFVEMDASEGRRQTTQGVWLAKAEGLTPCTLVMDLEGSDGVERGEDGTLFERQSALFGLAVSNILMINIWHVDIGRENASCKPLLKIVFEVMMRLLPPRKMTLMFVIRDKSPNTPVEKLEPGLLEGLRKIWDMVPKPADHEHTPLSEFFNVHVTFLPNFEYQKDEFKKEVAMLRERFQNSNGQGGLAGDRTEPGTVFSHSTKELWCLIKENKDLDLPTQRVMVATWKCERIAQEKIQSLKSDVKWLSLEQQGQEDVVEGFGKSVDAVVKKYLDEYTVDAEYLDEEVIRSKRKFLISEVWNVLRSSYLSQIEHHRVQALREFERSFDSNIGSSNVKDFLPNLRKAVLDSFNRGCEDAEVPHLEPNPSEEVVRRIKASKKELSENIDTYVEGKRKAKFTELKSTSEKRLQDVLSGHVVALLAEAGKFKSTTALWSEIRSLFEAEVAKAKSNFEDVFRRDFDPTEEETDLFRESLEKYGRGVVEEKVKAEAARAIDLMMERFKREFTVDEENIPRQWAWGNYDIPAITRKSKSSSLKLLSALVGIRLDNIAEDNDSIDVDSLIPLLLPESTSRFWTGTTSRAEKRDEAVLELSRKTSWRYVSERDIVIRPFLFKSTWESFENQTRDLIARAKELERNARSTSLTSAIGAVREGVDGVLIPATNALINWSQRPPMDSAVDSIRMRALDNGARAHEAHGVMQRPVVDSVVDSIRQCAPDNGARVPHEVLRRPAVASIGAAPALPPDVVHKMIKMASVQKEFMDLLQLRK